jgi:hypothetical protein
MLMVTVVTALAALIVRNTDSEALSTFLQALPFMTTGR